MTEPTEAAPEGVAEDTAPVEQVADQTVHTEQSGDDAPAEPIEGEGESPKPRKSAQERIDDLTRARREAERDAEYWRAKALERDQPRQDARPDANAPPNPADYEYGETDVGYIRAISKYEARQEFEQAQAERDQRQQVQSRLSQFNQRLAEQYPDGEPEGIAAIRRLPQLAPAITEVILTSEIGPKLADHLGANQSELARLSALPPVLQARELGKLEARLESPAAPRPKTATDAPAPTPQVRGGGGRFTVAPDTSDFAAFEKQYGG